MRKEVIIVSFLTLLSLINGGFACSEDFHTVLGEGDARYGRLDQKEALANDREAHQLAPNNFEALVKLTETCLSLGNELAEKRSRGAEAYFREAIRNANLMRQHFPEKAETYFYLAASYGSLPCLKAAARRRGSQKMWSSMPGKQSSSTRGWPALTPCWGFSTARSRA